MTRRDPEIYDQTRDSGLEFVQWSIHEAARLSAMSNNELLACHRSSGRMLVDRGFVVDDDHGTDMLGGVFLMLLGVVAGWMLSPLADAGLRAFARLVSS